jgi:hypothetical protein
MLDRERLRAELTVACEDAGLVPASFVVFVVDERRPHGTTPVAYLQPAGCVLPDTVAVFRAAGAERVARHHLVAHRLAIWNELPGIPEVAIGPMLRHELEHARRWERSGTSFFEADDLLRAAERQAGGSGYLALPSEREANAASAAYAAKALSAAQIEELRASADCAALLSHDESPADVVEATLAALSARDDWGLGMSGAERVVYLGAVRTACATWDATVARSLTAGRESPAIELVPPVSFVS